jgi:hypothetical protein
VFSPNHEPYRTNVETTQSHEREFEAKLSDDVGEELVKGEADGADQEEKLRNVGACG